MARTPNEDETEKKMDDSKRTSRRMRSLGPVIAVLGWAGMSAQLLGCGQPGSMTDTDVGMTIETDAGEVLTDPDAPLVEGMAPVLVSAVARQTGRFGDDLRIELRAYDLDGDATSLALALISVGGDPIRIYDEDLDGVAESNRTVLPLRDPILGAGEGDGLVIMAHLVSDQPALGSLELAVLDGAGRVSNSLTVPLTEQPVLALDALCDPGFILDRCEDGLGCRAGVPSVCTAGEAPILGRAVYYGDPGAVRVLVEGTDVDDDVTEIEIAFLDDVGAAVSLDLDGDSVPESDRFTADVRGASSAGAFFYAFSSSDAFAADVASVRIVVRDRGARESAALIAEQMLAPVRSMGTACDPRGFDRCGGSVCTPGVVGATNRCVDVRAARTMDCAAATTIDAFAPGPGFVGTAEGASLWNAPAGCSSGDPTGRPEGVVRLHVDRMAERIVLSTDNALSAFDTTVYVLADCGAEPVVAWCADDTAGAERSWLSHLELTRVPPGDYLVIVDSFSPAGGRFQLDVTAE